VDSPAEDNHHIAVAEEHHIHKLAVAGGIAVVHIAVVAGTGCCYLTFQRTFREDLSSVLLAASPASLGCSIAA